MLELSGVIMVTVGVIVSPLVDLITYCNNKHENNTQKPDSHASSIHVQWSFVILRYYIIDLRVLLFMLNLSQASTSTIGPIDTKICMGDLRFI